MQRTRVGQAIPIDTAQPSGTQSVAERILNTYASNRREQFELALKQAQFEYEQGKLTNKQFMDRRQGAIDALQKDLQNIRSTREKMISGELSRTAAAERFNAAAQNSARAQYSSQAFAAQTPIYGTAERLAAEERAQERRDIAQERREQEKKAKEKLPKLDKEVDAELKNTVVRVLQKVDAQIKKSVDDMGNDEKLDLYKKELSKELQSKIARARDPLVGVSLERLNAEGEKIIKNVKPGVFEEPQIAEPTSLPADEIQRRRAARDKEFDDWDEIRRSYMPPPGDDIDDDDEADETPSERFRSPTGYRPTTLPTGRSASLQAEMDSLQKREDEVVRRLQEIYDQPLPRVEDFDLIDNARRIWREKFGRNPTSAETRSVFSKAKEPAAEPTGVASNTLQSKGDTAQRPPLPTAVEDEPVEDEPPAIVSQEIAERRSLDPDLRASDMRALRGDIELEERELAARPGVRTLPSSDETVLDLDQGEWGALLDQELLRGAELSRLSQAMELADAGGLPSQGTFGPRPPAGAPPTDPFIADLASASAQQQTFQPTLLETFEEEDDVYSRANKKARAAIEGSKTSISLSPKDKQTIEKMVKLWDNTGKKQSFEQLVETVEKAYSDEKEEKIENLIAYLILKIAEKE